VPDALGVFPDCTVRREFAHARDVQNRHARPMRGVAIGVNVSPNSKIFFIKHGYSRILGDILPVNIKVFLWQNYEFS